MMMAAVSTNTLLLCCCFIITSTASQDSCNHYATVGQVIILPLNYVQDTSHTLKWYHERSLLFYRKSKTLVYGHQEDIDNEGSLKLKHVKKDNAGLYKSEVYKDGKLLNEKNSTLCVLDKIQKPTVVFTCPKSSSSSSVTFTCNIPQQPKGLTFKWYEKQKVLEKQSGQTLTRPVDQLKGNSFICEVSDQITSETSQPVTPNCLQGLPSPSSDKLFGFPFWTMVGILAGGGGLVLLLIVMTIVCCSRAKRKRQKHLEEEGELRLEWTNQQQQHHRYQQQQPAGRSSPRQHRPKPARDPERPRGPDTSGTNPRQPRPSPRTPGEGPRPVNESEEGQPPPLPQPRKKAPKTQRARNDVNAVSSAKKVSM